MRVAVVYDCLFPHTVGGAERWYRELSGRLAQKHEVTYVTRRQWDRGTEPDRPEGVRVVAVSGGLELYTASGRRKIGVPLRFGWGLFWHLLRNRRRYDVVHTCAFPYFSLIAARAACAFGGPRVVVDWFEAWTPAYWRQYLGPVGKIGEWVQRFCVRLSRNAFAFSRLHGERLREEGIPEEPTQLPGLWWGAPDAPGPGSGDATAEVKPQVLFAGRLIREKRTASIPPAIAVARATEPSLTALILGDGPELEPLRESVRSLGLEEVVECPGFVPRERLEEEMRSSMCLLLPSVREGYGAVVIEAASVGTPTIVTAAPDNSAVELITPGENGMVVPSHDPDELAAAMLEIAAHRDAWRRRTSEWFRSNADRISVEASLGIVEIAYAELSSQARS